MKHTIETAMRMEHLSHERSESGDPIEITPYLIELQFNQLADESDRRFFNSVPTSLQLPSKTVDRLRQLSARELAANEQFKRLVRDLRNNQDNRVRLTHDIPQSPGN